MLDAVAAEFIASADDWTRISFLAHRAGLNPGAVYARWHYKCGLMSATHDHTSEKILPGKVLQESSVENTSARTPLQALGMHLLPPDELPEAIVNVFAVARNKPELQSRLQAFLDKWPADLSS